MDITLSLLLHEYLNYELKNVSQTTAPTNSTPNAMSSNLRILGTRLGEKVMLKITSQLPPLRTKDVAGVTKIFLENFWETVFGKRIERFVVNDKNRIVFNDTDFQFITRVSSKAHETKSYQESCKHLVRYLVEGAFKSLHLRVETEIIVEGKNVQFSIDCAETA